MTTLRTWERRIRDLTGGKSGTLSMNRETYDDLVGSIPNKAPQALREGMCERAVFHAGTFTLVVNDDLQGDEIEFIPRKEHA